MLLQNVHDSTELLLNATSVWLKSLRLQLFQTITLKFKKWINLKMSSRQVHTEKSLNLFCFSQSDEDLHYMRSKYYKIKNKYWTTINIFLTIIKLRSYKYEFENID